MEFPAWNSVQDTARVHNFFELAGIALFFVVVIFELLAYAYGHRHDRLVDEQNAGRHLSDAQKQTIINAIKPFLGQAVSITSNPGNIESDDFARDFYDVIKNTEWNYQGDPDKFETIFDQYPIGVEVTLNLDDIQQKRVSIATATAYNALMGALHELDIVNSNEPAFANKSVPSGRIEIRIGSKPPKPGETGADRHPGRTQTIP